MKSSSLPSLVQKTNATILMVIPILFFIIFLHPLYLVQFFETNPLALLVFRALTLLATCSGIAGVIWYAYQFFTALITRKLSQPSLWFKLPLSIVTGSLILKFLLPIAFNQ